MRPWLRLLSLFAVGMMAPYTGSAASQQTANQHTSAGSAKSGQMAPAENTPGKEGGEPKPKPRYEVERQMGRGKIDNDNGDIPPAIPPPEAASIRENTDKQKWAVPERITHTSSPRQAREANQEKAPDSRDLRSKTCGSGPCENQEEGQPQIIEEGRPQIIKASSEKGHGPWQGQGDPGLIAACVASGAIMGLIAGPWLVWRKFRIGHGGRPYGDISKEPGQPNPARLWLQGIADPTIFQPELALRDKLILPEELRSLRSRYLVTGNFSFSMMLPTLFGIYLASVNTVSGPGAGLLMRFLWPTALSFLTSTFLSSYALDQRHRFRAEYRLVVRKGWEQARAKEGESRLEGSPSGEAGAAGAGAGK